MELNFVKLPQNRKIQIDVSELKRLGYKLPCWVSFEFAEGINPVYKLVPGRQKKSELSPGYAKLYEDGTVTLPKVLTNVTQYAVRYFDRSFQIWL